MLIHRSKQHAATGQHPDRSLTISATQETNRPHCLYRRPAIRQPRKAAHDRDNPVRLTKVKRLNRENDPGMQCAPRIPAAEGRDTESN